MFTGTDLKSVDQLSPSQCKVSSGTNDRQNISLDFESITILQHMTKYIAKYMSLKAVSLTRNTLNRVSLMHCTRRCYVLSE